MLRIACFLLVFIPFCPLARAQDNSLLQVMRGLVLDYRSTGPGLGELSVRTPDYEVHRCLSDGHTYSERLQNPTPLTGEWKGLDVELIADRDTTEKRCYARAVRALNQEPKRRIGQNLNPIPFTVLDSLFPRGNLTFAGVVLRLDPDRLLLRTRNDGQKMFTLRQDTRYLEGGNPVRGEQLQINRRVFVRAGKTFDDELEAYQVVWGEILRPAE